MDTTKLVADLMSSDLEDVLEHHGVKGMKWGQHKVKPSDREIKDARKRLGVKQDELYKAEDKLFDRKNGKPNKAAEKVYNDLSKAYLKNPDRATATYMTSGEKAATAILTLAFVPAGAGYAAFRVGANKNAIRSVNKANRVA